MGGGVRTFDYKKGRAPKKGGKEGGGTRYKCPKMTKKQWRKESGRWKPNWNERRGRMQGGEWGPHGKGVLVSATWVKGIAENWKRRRKVLWGARVKGWSELENRSGKG